MKSGNVHKIILIAVVLAILAVGFVFLCISPIDIMENENRTAEKVLPFSLSAFLDSSFQDSVELALGDQLPFASLVKAKYNAFFESLGRGYAAAQAERGEYVRLTDTVYMYQDALVYLSEGTEHLDAALKRAEKINEHAAAHPEISFAAYYISRDADIDFVSGEKSALSDEILSALNIQSTRKGKFDISSFEEFKQFFFSTDHHWNADGQYKGYTEILKLLKPAEAPVERLGAAEVQTGQAGPDAPGRIQLGTFSGSKSRYEGLSYTEPYFVYDYKLPETLSVKINGAEAESCNNRRLWIDGKMSATAEGEMNPDLTYASVCGYDSGLFEFTDNEKEGRLLVIGESFDNAIIELLACHFEKLYSVDLRNYEKELGRPFDFDEFVRNNSVDSVLLDGSSSFWYSDEFDF